MSRANTGCLYDPRADNNIIILKAKRGGTGRNSSRYVINFSAE